MKHRPAWILTVLFCTACSPIQASPTPAIDRLDAIPAGAVKYTPDQDPHPPIMHDPGYSKPLPLPGPINTAGAEDSPFIIPSGNVLYFFFSPSIAQTPEEELAGGAAGIYRSNLQADGWSEPERLQLTQAGEQALDGCPFFQDEELWFCSARKGNYRGVDFWIAHERGNGFEAAVNAGEQLNQVYQIGEMHLSPNGRDLYFHSQAAGGMGGLDIWVTHREGESWTAPENVTELNSSADEGWPYVSPAGNEFWFTRMVQGSPAIFRSVWNGESWSDPELVVSQFAGEPTLDAAGNLYFVHHFLAGGELVEADIYVAHPQ
jgi:hypothetical protein